MINYCILHSYITSCRSVQLIVIGCACTCTCIYKPLPKPDMSTTDHPLSPAGSSPHHPHPPPGTLVPHPSSLSSSLAHGAEAHRQLQARLYSSHEVYSHSRPQLRVARRRPQREQASINCLSQSSLTCTKCSPLNPQDAPTKRKQPRLEPLPALSAYQQRQHHEIHGPAEPLPPNLARKTKKAGSVQPLQEDMSVSPLPPLQGDLEYRQRAMEGE